MSTTTLPEEHDADLRTLVHTGSSVLDSMLRSLASLKLTVVLLALACGNVLFGTLAQAEMDVWKAVSEYFRIDIRNLFIDGAPWLNLRELVTWVPFDIFTPKAWFPEGGPFAANWGFLYPRGWTIGILMMLNLLAAHLVRFKVVAKGTRLIVGWAGIVFGIFITWLVISSGNNVHGVEGENLVSYETLWRLAGVAAFALTAASIWGSIGATSRAAFWGLMASSALCAALSVYLISSEPLSASSMRILYQLAKGTIAGLAILIPSWVVFGKRAGIVALHAGIGLMMGYEVYVGMHAARMEARMQIEEGQVMNYTYDIRAVELAVVDPSPSDHDLHTVIPAARLQKGVKFHDDRLPFDMELVEYHENSEIQMRLPKDKDVKTPATKGRGLEILMEPRAVGTGVETNQKADVPSGYVRILDPKSGKEDGVYLVSALLSRPETITFDGKPYQLSLRFRRDYKPYQIELKDVQKNDYVGTNRPKDYRSKIHLVDERNGVDKDFEIWMNNPLRYAGETFYQSSYIPAGAMGDNREMTDFQVVINEGWMTPYVACMIVVVGMLYHFWLMLSRFLRTASAVPVTDGVAEGYDWTVLAPALALATVAGLYASMAAFRSAKPVNGFDLAAFSAIPIFDGGRAQPIDSYALNNLMQISERQTFKDAEGNKRTAVEWFLDSIAKPEDVAAKYPVFRIDHPDIVKSLNLDWRESHLYSREEIEKTWPQLQSQIQTAGDKRGEDRSIEERKLLSLAGKLNQFEKMKAAFLDMRDMPQGLPVMPTREEFQKDPQGAQARASQVADLLHNARDRFSQMHLPLVVPTHLGRGKSEEGLLAMLKTNWEPTALASIYAHIGGSAGEKIPALDLLEEIRAAYRDGKADVFNAKVVEYRKLIDGLSDDERTVPGTGSTLNVVKTNYEAFYNRFAPSWLAFMLYVPGMALILLGWLMAPMGFFRHLRAAGWGITAVAFILHTYALVGRIYISGRPPVTNLYSASVFIGWAIVLMGLGLELVSRMGISTLAAALAGFLTLRVADALRFDGDTLSVLEPVLDTQFWLATHVVCITLGYATSYVAGLLGTGYLLGGVLTPYLNSSIRQRLANMTYGTVCFALLFSFFGTVLGGLWADDSWGRFWGWDPKENGALIIVLWNALILHARWDGMARGRGVAILSVLGNIVVTWSFFGVNELGVGLHSYGFTEGRLRYIGMFALAHVVIAAIGSLPTSAWMSYRAEDNRPTPPRLGDTAAS
ncbi:cytochrome c biogenesis protein [Planctomyces sp. SH-PL14]|uniref:cytochrome c biogenesis protein n=1 Tax=Planctomyces sp. SH-PL14 TaxID=1632864 RepID=UPI00078B7974|nr:cytochrome c biogenesis protein CcsA [Planctomyces sp. SH-PL14]AMV16364.1 Cytochrome c biogenesis protein CcsA [Planctomyces sp. SH-PL14]